MKNLIIALPIVLSLVLISFALSTTAEGKFWNTTVFEQNSSSCDLDDGNRFILHTHKSGTTMTFRVVDSKTNTDVFSVSELHRIRGVKKISFRRKSYDIIVISRKGSYVYKYKGNGKWSIPK